MTGPDPNSNGGFLARLISGRWFIMFGAFLIMAGAGATYIFGIYSKAIKSALGYNQSTLNLLSTFKDIGANVGVISGLIAEFAPIWLVLLLGSTLNFAGYFLMWLSITQRIAKPALWQMCLYIGIGANSQNFANTGSLVTCVKNFPQSRGMMLGLLKGYVGLSGAVFTQLYHAIYGNDGNSLILMIAWLPAVLSVLFVFTMRAIEVSSHPREVTVFYQYLYVSVALALSTMALTILQNSVSFSHLAYVGSATLVCFWLFLPLVMAIREEYFDYTNVANDGPSTGAIVDQSQQGSEKGMSFGENAFTDVGAWWEAVWEKPQRGNDDYSILQALLSVDMLIIFVATFCGLGCSLAAINNMGQIGESLGYSTKTISAFVSLISIWNYFGRVSSGFVSEILVSRYKIPRPLLMSLALFIGAIGDFFVAFPWRGSIYVASLLIGFAFGAQLTLLFTIISELFGLKYYARLFNCGQLASPLGSYVMNVHVVGRLYDHEATRQLALAGVGRATTKELTCMGSQCFTSSFLILSGTNMIGAMVMLLLVWRTMAFYRGDIYNNFKGKVNDIDDGIETKMTSFNV